MDLFALSLGQLSLHTDPYKGNLSDDEITALTCLFVEKTLLSNYTITDTRTYIKGKLHENGNSNKL